MRVKNLGKYAYVILEHSLTISIEIIYLSHQLFFSTLLFSFHNFLWWYGFPRTSLWVRIMRGSSGPFLRIVVFAPLSTAVLEPDLKSNKLVIEVTFVVIIWSGGMHFLCSKNSMIYRNFCEMIVLFCVASRPNIDYQIKIGEKCSISPERNTYLSPQFCLL